MANLIVTFTRPAENRTAQSWFPVEQGEAAETEKIEIGASSAAGDLMASAKDFIVRLEAEADCWVTIGADPVAEDGSGRKLPAGTRDQFSCQPGSKVAVIAADESTA